MRPPDDDAQKTPLRKGGPPKRGSSLVSANPNPNPNPNPNLPLNLTLTLTLTW